VYRSVGQYNSFSIIASIVCLSSLSFTAFLKREDGVERSSVFYTFDFCYSPRVFVINMAPVVSLIPSLPRKLPFYQLVYGLRPFFEVLSLDGNILPVLSNFYLNEIIIK